MDSLNACLKREAAALRDTRRRLADFEAAQARERAGLTEQHMQDLATASQESVRMRIRLRQLEGAAAAAGVSLPVFGGGPGTGQGGGGGAGPPAIPLTAHAGDDGRRWGLGAALSPHVAAAAGSAGAAAAAAAVAGAAAGGGGGGAASAEDLLPKRDC